MKVFEERCPKCKKSLMLWDRRKLLLSSTTACKHCGQELQVNEKSSERNCIFLSILFSMILGLYFDLPLIDHVIIAIFSALLFVRFLNIFYSLQVSTDDSAFTSTRDLYPNCKFNCIVISRIDLARRFYYFIRLKQLPSEYFLRYQN